MNKRPDLDAVYLMVKEKKMSIKAAKEWMKLPYFDIPLNARNKTEFDLFADAEISERKMHEPIATFRSEPFYFQTFVGKMNETFFKINMSEDGLTFQISLIPFVGGKAFAVLEFTMKGDAEDIKGAYFSTDHEKTKWFMKVAPQELNSLFEIGAIVLSRLAVFREYNNQKDYYMVNVVTEKKPKVKGIPTPKEQLQQAQGAHILYLDRLPSAGGEATGEGSEKRPHQRRGTWVTLRAERYRYHPKYQVEKGVYRKPAWVGPKEAIVEGNIYTILE